MSLDGLVRRLDRLAKVPERATRDAARTVAASAKAEGDRIGPIHLGRRKRAVRLRAVARIRGRGNHVRATVWGRPAGPWSWVTDGTDPHAIVARRRRGYLKAAGYPHPVRRVQHPGATGQGAWRRVRAQARRDVPRAYAAAVRKAIG